MAPSSLQKFIQSTRETYDRLAQDGEIPRLLVQPGDPPVRPLDHRTRPALATVVLSQNEIHAHAPAFARSARSVESAGATTVLYRRKRPSECRARGDRMQINPFGFPLGAGDAIRAGMGWYRPGLG